MNSEAATAAAVSDGSTSVGQHSSARSVPASSRERAKMIRSTIPILKRRGGLPLAEVPRAAIASLLGRRGRLVGDHPWAGQSGEIVRVERTIVGFAVVVRLDGSTRECMVFDGRRHWRGEPEGSGGKVVSFPRRDPEDPDEDGAA